jgi:hypothetical protein
MLLTITLDMWRALFAGERTPDFPQWISDRYADLIPTVASLAAGLGLTALHQGNLDEAARFYDLFAHDNFVRVGGDAEELLNLSNFAEIADARNDRDRLVVLYDRLKPFEDRCIVDGIGGAWIGPVHISLSRIAFALGCAEAARAHLAAARAIAVRADAALITLVVDALSEKIGNPVPADARVHADRAAVAQPIARFRRDGDTWQLSWGDERVTLRDAKGLRDIAHLLARPAVEVHVSQLVGSDTAMYGDLGEVLDRTAREAYRRRLGDIDAELAAAEENNDLGRAERVRIERDFLVAELSAAVGLGGRARRPGDSAERARKAVAGRIKQAIDRIGGDAPSLGRHLRNSVTTGTYCSYHPEQPVDWQL